MVEEVAAGGGGQPQEFESPHQTVGNVAESQHLEADPSKQVIFLYWP